MDRLKRVCKALAKRGFEAKAFPDVSSLREYLLPRISGFKRVGVGGSLTIREIGVLSDLERMGCELYDHWKKGLSPEEVLDLRKKQLTSDLFLTSANAITEDGLIVCMDGIGNRVSAMVFGPSKVVLVAGKNKLTPDIHSAIRRVRDVAAPKNAERFGYGFLPCVSAGRCVDCSHPKRICRALLILEGRPLLTDFEVYLVDEELGF